APSVRDAMLAAGVMAGPIGASVVAFCPPLVISDAQLDRCVEALADAVERIQARMDAELPDIVARVLRDVRPG
ncbi:MAG: hypothetical protein OJK14_15135, partial [Achromobacter sp.]|nr:hypothetical protein [Achromobacter sp.]